MVCALRPSQRPVTPTARWQLRRPSSSPSYILTVDFLMVKKQFAVVSQTSHSAPPQDDGTYYQGILTLLLFRICDTHYVHFLPILSSKNRPFSSFFWRRIVLISLWPSSLLHLRTWSTMAYPCLEHNQDCITRWRKKTKLLIQLLIFSLQFMQI